MEWTTEMKEDLKHITDYFTTVCDEEIAEYKIVRRVECTKMIERAKNVIEQSMIYEHGDK